MQNLAKVLTQGELFKLKLAGKLLIAGEEGSVPQTSPKSSGWGSELLANCNGGLDPDGKGCRLAGEESAGQQTLHLRRRCRNLTPSGPKLSRRLPSQGRAGALAPVCAS